MKVLLDENIPHDLRHLIVGHEVFTVAFMGWTSISNGELLALAGEGGVDVMVTKDTGVEYEQYLGRLPVGVVVMRARTNKLDDLRVLVPALLERLGTMEPRTIGHVGWGCGLGEGSSVRSTASPPRCPAPLLSRGQYGGGEGWGEGGGGG